MKIIINTSILRFGGAVQVALSFIQECRKFTEHKYHVFLGQGVGDIIDREMFPDNFTFYETPFGEITLWKTFYIQRTLRKLEKEIEPDIVVTTSGPSYWHSNAPQVMGYNLPLYIYPESPYVKELSGLKKSKLRVKKLFHSYFFKRDADAFVVQTDDVNERVKNLFNTDKVFTVTNTMNGFFLNPENRRTFLPEKRAEEVRLLTVSSWYPHKNLDLIPGLAKELKDRGLHNFKFVLTLKEADYEKHIPRELRGQIKNVGYVEPRDCPALYKECDVMFLPTLAECFSASYPEAMIMNIPIITSDLGFARSICGEAALYFKPKQITDAADLVVQLNNDSQLYEKLVQLGRDRIQHFDTPEIRVEKYLKIASDIVKEQKK